MLISINMQCLIRKFSMLLILLAMNIVSIAQVYNFGNIYVNPNEDVYVQGNFNNQTSGQVKLQGTIHLQGHWNNNHSSAEVFPNTTGGLVRMVGSSLQNIAGSTDTYFNNLEIANVTHVNLGKNALVKQVLTFTDGKIITNSNYFIVQSTLPTAIIGHDEDSYIVGNLRRYFSGTSIDFDLPVGTMPNYELATIRFNIYSGISYINTRYNQAVTAAPANIYPSTSAIYVFPDELNPVTSPWDRFMGRFSYVNEFLDYGYWTVTPNAGSANYKLTVTDRGHTNGGSVPGQHALIKRNNSSSAWRAEGFYAFNSQIGSGTEPITVYMDQMSTFSDFIIGKSTDDWGPLGIVLTGFDAVCGGSSVQLTWSTSNEENNDHFTIERSKNMLLWEEVCRVPGSLFSQGNLNYSASDLHPFSGLSYYRLKQTDTDGNVSVFENEWIRHSNCSLSGDLEVNIYKDGDQNVIVNFTAWEGEQYNLYISDPSGKIIYKNSGSAESGINTLSVPLNVASGLYFVSFRSEFSQGTKKIVK